jgi:hypothetical protein
MFSKINSKIFSNINNKLKGYINYKFLIPFIGTTYAIYHCTGYQIKQFYVKEYSKRMKIKDPISLEDKSLNEIFDNLSLALFPTPDKEGYVEFNNDLNSIKYFMYSKNNKISTNYIISIFFFNIMTQVICKIPIISLPSFTVLLIYNSFNKAKNDE